MKPLLHQATQDRLEALVRRPRGAYIFTGPPHVGKLTTALWLAQRFNCSGTGDDGCRACRLIEAGNHPDVTVVRPADKASIGIAQVQQLQQAVSLTRDSTEGRRVVAITPSDNLTTEAQNCLLKTIEEPPLGTIIILAVEQLTGLLGTVRSRCQVVQFLPLETGRVSAYLQDQLSLPVAQADHMAELAAGSVGLAISLGRDPELYERYRQAEAMAEQIGRSSRFERLVLASELAQSGPDVDRLIAALAGAGRRRLRQTASTGDQDSLLLAASYLQAIERFELYRRSNVSLKTALAGLLVEL